VRALRAGIGVAVATFVAAVGHASPPRGADPPCRGCLLSLPADDAPAPLLVLLHGDGQSPATLYAKWRPWAEARGIAVLALACPADEGCQGSWWRWDGDPRWLEGQVDAVGAVHAIDRSRLWLVGWSGGASYMGWRTQAIERTFAALVLHGGGMAPPLQGCPTPRASTYFLVGDRNPLHRLAMDLRDHYRSCRQDLTWTLLPGADHEGEWSALDAHRGNAILDWLATRRR
jgi:predicted esterase